MGKNKKMKEIAAGLTAAFLLFAGGMIPHAQESQPMAASTDNTTEPETSIRIAVASDLHYLAPELTDHGEYFEKIITNADGKLMDYSEEIAEAFTDRMIEEQPDVLILTGDLTFNGERLSLEQLTEKLERIEKSGVTVYVIPGNHDIDSTMAVRYEGDGYEPTENVSAEQFTEICREYGYDRADPAVLSMDPESCSYMAQLMKGLRLLAIDVNGNQQHGFLTDETLEWVENQLIDAQEAGEQVIAVSHQNLIRHNELFIDGYVMGHAGILENLYSQYHVICNLSGHMHIQHIAESEEGVPEILTSALSIAPSHYGVLDVTLDTMNPDPENNHTVSVVYSAHPMNVSGWAKEKESKDAVLLSFEEYAEVYFMQNTRRQLDVLLEESEDKSEMIQYMVDANYLFFSGRPDKISFEDERYLKWRQNGTLWGVYLLTIEQGERGDFTGYSFYR